MINRPRIKNKSESTPPDARSQRQLLIAGLLTGAAVLTLVGLNRRDSEEPQQFEVPKAELEALKSLTDQQILDMGINRYMVFRAGDGENLTEIATRIDGVISSPGSDPSVDQVIDEVRDQAKAHDGTPSFDTGERFVVYSPPMGPVIIP